MAFRRILVLDRIEEDLKAIEVKNLFLEFGGLEVFHKYLRPFGEENNY